MTQEESIKHAFSRVKQDIFFFGEELQQIKSEIADLKTEIKLISSFIHDLKLKFLEEKPEKQEKTIPTEAIISPTHTPTHPEKIPTIQQITPTHMEIPTDNMLSYVLKRQNMGVSTGNRGVPTNKQTNKQTNQQIIQHIKIQEKPEKQEKTNHLEQAKEILDSLDALKKELRIKIKRLTPQEISVFSLLYSLESQGEIVDYPLLAEKLSLSEASIRDYILKIQKKGIPVYKEKLNNKKVVLHISQELKKIASLDTILKLREL